jgi:hypothetical protein
MDKNGTLWQSVTPSWVLGCAQTDTNLKDITDGLLYLCTCSAGTYHYPGGPARAERVFTFAEIHEDVIDDGSFAQADPGSATSTATL